MVVQGSCTRTASVRPSGPATALRRSGCAGRSLLAGSRQPARTSRRGPNSNKRIVALVIQEEQAVVETPTGPMRTSLFMPQAVNKGAKFPGVIVYSEIYQVTGPVERLCRRLAGEGYVVAAGDVYHEFTEGPMLYSDTDLGNEYKVKKELASYDSDAEAMVDWLVAHPHTEEAGRVGTFGICLGGGLALRAATAVPRVRAAGCLFATDLHNEGLGVPRSESPDRAEETLDIIARGGMAGEALLVMGNRDTHIDLEGRHKIRNALCDGHATFQWAELGADHAFTRDDFSKGRYDPAISDIAWAMCLELFQRRLTLGLDDDAGSTITPM